MAEFTHKSVTEALEASIQAADLPDEAAATVAAARALARKIDAWDVIAQYAMEDIAGSDSKGARPAVPQNDNVSLATMLKYCEALGLTMPSQAVKTKKTQRTEPLDEFSAFAKRHKIA